MKSNAEKLGTKLKNEGDPGREVNCDKLQGAVLPKYDGSLLGQEQLKTQKSSVQLQTLKQRKST
jgi:hypothetical protein